MSQHDELKAELIKTDDEFRRLYEEHQAPAMRAIWEAAEQAVPYKG